MNPSEKPRKRKKIGSRTRLIVFQRDNYTCTTCGQRPDNTDPNSALELDHIVPFANGGTDEISNLKTSCRRCNRGKGNDESFNRDIENDFDALLNRINPEILKTLNSHGIAKVVANQEDYATLSKMNSLENLYKIEIILNTLIGSGVGKNFGIYTIYDNGGTKVNFTIKNLEKGS